MWNQKRTKCIFELAQYNWVIIPIIVAFIYRVLRWFGSEERGSYIVIDNTIHVAWSSLLCSLLLGPASPPTVLQFLTYCFPLRPFQLSEQPIQRSFNRLLICLVTRGDQIEVVKRSVIAIQDMYQKLDQRISLHVLTEAANAHNFHGMFKEHVWVHAVPLEYRPSKAKYKARNLEWFRINMHIDKDDWVLHLDEETLVDEYCINTCLDFITKQTCDMGQGVIHFNCHNFWSSVFTGVGDVRRIQGDYGDVQWRLRWLNKAAVGIRGSFLLIRGSVENACTWDNDSLTEDYAFCLKAMKMGYSFGFIPAIARELSPATVGDFVRQRCRWYTGIRRLGDFWGYYVLLRTAAIALQPLYYLASWPFLESSTVRQPQWLYDLTVLGLSMGLGTTAWFTFLQDWDAGLSLAEMFTHQIQAIVYQPVVAIADGYALLISVLCPDEWFYVITKN
ncbi:hypothetical protein PTNB73_04958 [Pyrenophora teres f. teres]|nr:hypothetical protein HRS9122_03303 [Pyrenophora teres f. teres]KAE8866864.1 hypothetical protein PTNB73_04958 [Pyrenophora teres f. teres]